MKNDDFDESLAELLSDVENLPSMPAVAAEVVRLTRDESSTLDQLAQALSLDPALSGKLLALSNSAVFNLGTPVSTLQRATMVLGMKTVKLLALSFSLVGSLPTGGKGPFDFQAYWRRSVVCAVAGRSFGVRLGSRMADEAFVCGLLSRIGQLVLGHGLPDRYAPVLEAAKGSWPDYALERTLIGFDGGDVAVAMLASWSLPQLVIDGAACAHAFERTPALDAPEARELIDLMRVASCCEELICGDDKQTAMNALTERCEQLGLDAEGVEGVLMQLEQAIPETAAMLELEMRAVRMDEVLRQAQEQLVKETLGMATEMHQSRRHARELEIRNQLLQDKANRDSLTGLPNRALFDETLARCFADRRAGASPRALGLLIVDVDLFKRFNDTYGHQTGDEVLRMVAEAIRHSMREEDLAARYGGEEFGAILPAVSAEGLEAAAERIRAGVESAQLERGGAVLSVTVSVGGAWLERLTPGQEPEELIAAADRHLYEAKAAGRNCCVVRAAEPA